MPKRTVLACCIGVAANVDCSAGETLKPATAPAVCELPSNVAQTVSLEPNCSYRGMLTIAISDVVVDCRGAVIDARGMRHGILIKGESIRNVAVRNCEVVRATTQGILIAAPDTDPRMAALSKEERYRLSPRDISISDTKVSQSGSVGIYVDSYAQDTKLTGVTVEHSRSAGIYLEHSSVRTRIEKSKIRYNGFRNATREGTTARREGIAIDSSANNIIVGNVISDNARGGIFLYKNCWERHDRPGTVPRWQSSSFNLITHNRIENERVGIWVASRQGKNLTSWKCGDPEIADGFYRDYADHNTISGNVIINSDVGIRIFDSNTTVVDNQTIRAGSACIEVGAPILQRLGVKIAGTRLSQNSCSLAASTTQQEFECNGNPTSDRSGETYACPPAPATKRDGP